MQFNVRQLMLLCPGNTLTGEVTSESDMRPSDATFLAQNYGTPIYVDVAVWNDTSITRTQMTEYERNHGWPFDCGSGEEAPPQSSTTPNGRPSEAREQHSIVAPLASTDDLAGILCVPNACVCFSAAHVRCMRSCA